MTDKGERKIGNRIIKNIRSGRGGIDIGESKKNIWNNGSVQISEIEIVEDTHFCRTVL